MSTIAAELEPEGLSLPEYVSIVRRRLRPMLIALVVGLATAAGLAVLLPPQYRSTATILIEQQELPSDLVRSTVTSFADERVQVISQRVMTTETLLGIIRRYDLYPKERSRETRDQIIKRMRDDIGVKMISADVVDPRSGAPTKATIAFTVSFTDRSADEAAKVANELTTLFLNDNVETRTELADGAATFLKAQVAQVSEHLGQVESQLSAFEGKHFDSLPDLTQLNMGLIDRSEQQLEEAESHVSSLEEQEVFLQAQLAQLKPDSAVYSDSGQRVLSPSDRLKMLRSELAADRAQYGPAYPDIGRLTREIAGLETTAKDPTNINDLRRDLDDAQSKLAAAQKRYGPEYPDRLRLEREVQSFERDLATAAKAAASKSAAASGDTESTDADNPAYVQIRAQLNATRDDLTATEARETKLQTDLDRFQHRVMETPLIQKQYEELTQDYDVTKANYANLRARLAEAEIGKNLEIDRKGERFTLIEPPLVPEEPASPNRPLVMILGAVLSLLLAVGVAALLEALDGTVRGRRDLASLVAGIPPLAIIPDIELERPAGQVWIRRAIVAGACLAIIVAGALAVNFFYEPLDVLWFVMLRHLGLG
ncbi:MAG TPA: Wzz/FepE/Etk N-terminal domain-containing protein [Steroidobacteraceae bacterium]|nr:Wzz/FepE/Etk N-terminal domain-containing protein [Steroidobacteraceae bacterium]